MKHSVSFTNTEEYLIIQIPIFFVNNKQAPMDLYKFHTVHVPLDKDTYDGKESKYTRLDLKQNHLAISKEEYIDLMQHQLNSCLKLHTDYLCPNLRLTASTHYSVLRKIARDHYRLNKHNDTTFYNYSYSFIAQRVINRRIGYSQFNIHSLIFTVSMFTNSS